MDGPNTLQVIIAAVLSSSFIGGVFTLLTKKVSSPENKTSLASLSNEFASQLLTDARAEREELRLTIRELERLLGKNEDTIKRLNALLVEKDRRITELDEHRKVMLTKINLGQRVTLTDLFGDIAPPGIIIKTDQEDI